MDVMQHFEQHGFLKSLKLIRHLTPAAQRHYAADLAEIMGCDTETAKHLIHLTRGNAEGLVSDEELADANNRAFHHCTHDLQRVNGRNMTAYFASGPDRYQSAFTTTQHVQFMLKTPYRAHMLFLADYMQVPGRLPYGVERLRAYVREKLSTAAT